MPRKCTQTELIQQTNLTTTNKTKMIQRRKEGERAGGQEGERGREREVGTGNGREWRGCEALTGYIEVHRQWQWPPLASTDRSSGCVDLHWT